MTRPMTDLERFTPTSDVLTIRFPSVHDAECFKSWLCSLGETSFRESWDGDQSNIGRFVYHAHPNEVTAEPES